MNVFESLSENPPFQGAMKQAVMVPEIVSSPAPKRLDPTRGEYQEDTRPWSEIPLIEMLPAEYRVEAEEILAKNPNKARILEMCKLGVFDCWTAMERLGINEVE